MNAPSSRHMTRFFQAYLAVLAALTLSKGCAFTVVEPGSVGVRYNNMSGLLEEDLKPGLHVELTGLHRVWRLPTSYMQLNYSDGDSDSSLSALSIRTKDNNTVSVDVSIPYRIIPGRAWGVMKAGNHIGDGQGGFRFQRFAKDTATSVLRERLAQLRSEDFYNTDRRLEVAADALEELNKKLKRYDLEALTVLVRASYFRPEYETQLASIQFNEQQKLLDGATLSVTKKQQALDNYQQQTNALVSAKEQEWQKRISDLDRAYQVGTVDVGGSGEPGAARRKLEALSEQARATLIAKAAQEMGVEPDSISDAHLLGIKNVEAEAVHYRDRVSAEALGIAARLQAEGEARIAKIQGAYETRLNQLLSSGAGRAFVAYQAASNVNFAPELTFQSREGIPSVLRLGDFAKQFMGR